MDLESAGATLNGKAANAAQELQDLKNQLMPLQDGWLSPASSYYEPLQAEWNWAADGLFGPDGILEQIAAALNITWNNYTDCEWANVKGWQRT